MKDLTKACVMRIGFGGQFALKSRNELLALEGVTFSTALMCLPGDDSAVFRRTLSRFLVGDQISGDRYGLFALRTTAASLIYFGRVLYFPYREASS